MSGWWAWMWQCGRQCRRGCGCRARPARQPRWQQQASRRRQQRRRGGRLATAAAPCQLPPSQHSQMAQRRLRTVCVSPENLHAARLGERWRRQAASSSRPRSKEQPRQRLAARPPRRLQHRPAHRTQLDLRPRRYTPPLPPPQQPHGPRASGAPSLRRPSSSRPAQQAVAAALAASRRGMAARCSRSRFRLPFSAEGLPPRAVSLHFSAGSSRSRPPPRPPPASRGQLVRAQGLGWQLQLQQDKDLRPASLPAMPQWGSPGDHSPSLHSTAAAGCRREGEPQECHCLLAWLPAPEPRPCSLPGCGAVCSAARLPLHRWCRASHLQLAWGRLLASGAS